MTPDNIIYVIKTHDAFEHVTQVLVYKRENHVYTLVSTLNCLDLTTALERVSMLSGSQSIVTEAV